MDDVDDVDDKDGLDDLDNLDGALEILMGQGRKASLLSASYSSLSRLKPRLQAVINYSHDHHDGDGSKRDSWSGGIWADTFLAKSSGYYNTTPYIVFDY